MHVRRFFGDIGGVAAIEFAFIAPVMILAYFGLAEVTQGMIAQRRISHTSSTIGDLVAQGSATSPAEISDIFTVGDTIVAPFPTAPLAMRVSSITADASGVTHVDWSQASNMAPLAKGAAVAVPATIFSANQSVVEADVTYAYSSPVNYVLSAPITFSNTYYLKPRISDQVTCKAC